MCNDDDYDELFSGLLGDIGAKEITCKRFKNALRGIKNYDEISLKDDGMSLFNFVFIWLTKQECMSHQPKYRGFSNRERIRGFS